MSRQSEPQKPPTKLWQFSLAEMLVAISLVAVTCGAFRFDIRLGIGVLHLTIAVLIASIRARAAALHQEELWHRPDSPDYVRTSVFQHVVNSFGFALAGFFFFCVGSGIVAILEYLVANLIFYSWRTTWGEVIINLVFFTSVPTAGIVSFVMWLVHTWPKTYPPNSSPSDKIG